MSNNPKVVKFPNKVTGKLRIGNTAADYGVYGTGTVQKFELGTRYRVDDRVFRYAKAGTNLDGRLGAFDRSAWFAENIVSATVIGQEYVVITTDSTSGDLTNGFGTANNMVGGYFSIPDSTTRQFRRIEGHVAAPTGTTVKVYLDGPLTKAFTADLTEWCPNPYNNLQQPGSSNAAAMGVPTTTIVSGSFFWIQTWGPTWIVQFDGADFTNAYDNLAEFTEGGNVTDFGTNDGAQIAGFIMGERRVSGNWLNPPFVYLTISP